MALLGGVLHAEFATLGESWVDGADQHGDWAPPSSVSPSTVSTSTVSTSTVSTSTVSTTSG